MARFIVEIDDSLIEQEHEMRERIPYQKKISDAQVLAEALQLSFGALESEIKVKEARRRTTGTESGE